MRFRPLAALASFKFALVLVIFFFASLIQISAQTTLKFDELANNIIVADQYLNSFGVKFYSNNSLFPVHTHQICGQFCSTTSLPNFISTLPDTGGVLNVEFQYPVSNLTFFMIGVESFFNQFGVIDVYRNGAFHATFPIFGNGMSTVGYTLGSITDISKIVIRNLTDPAGVGFDDFTFTVPWKIRITNSQVNGFIEGTTKNGMPGANITLLGTALPTAFSGGSYSWSFTGPVAQTRLLASNHWNKFHNHR